MSKAVIVEGARLNNEKLSRFMVNASLEKAARLMGKQIKDLIPAGEFAELHGQSATPPVEPRPVLKVRRSVSKKVR